MNYAPHSELQQLFERLQDTPSPHGLGGLVALIEGEKEALPLQLLKVRSQIAGNCAKTVVEQHFGNSSASTIEVTHIFPLPIEGALISMELQAGDVCIRGLCKERTTAEVVYHDAKARGKQVALITQERDDVHTLKVSGIPPKTEVIVRFTIIEFLDSIDGRFVWRFPTTIAPRFRPGASIGHRGPGVVSDSDRVPDASFLHAPARLEGGTALDLEVKVFAPVRDIESNFHTVN
ncbi:MAG: VIT domain-containing protein, partial [Planctomycetota bacterium]|nr:VIT domain-containing protein [Planctomycetota bacterium]